jgi:hypothetical protein
MNPGRTMPQRETPVLSTGLPWFTGGQRDAQINGPSRGEYGQS